MNSDADALPAFASASSTTRYAPYNSSIADSASSSSASVWSDTASQSSDDTSISGQSSDCEPCDSYFLSKQTTSGNVGLSRRSYRAPQVDAVPSELRQNPRRSAPGCHAKLACPPALVRQSDRKVSFVDSLVGRFQFSACFLVVPTLIALPSSADSSTQIVEAIWPLSSVVCRSELGTKAVLPLRTFIQETLRRSRTSYSTLQVALYYLILIKPHVPKHNFTMEQPEDRYADRALQCGRRMFLAALILASKYLQDRNYSARAWSKISGLNTMEINQNEIAFLLAVNWKLHISDDVFRRWTEIVLKYTPPTSPPSPGSAMATSAQQAFDWKQLILKLNPELTNIEGLITSTSAPKKTSDLCFASPRSILNAPQENHFGMGYDSREFCLTPKSSQAPSLLEPVPFPVYTPGRLAPTLGMLPTPRLTPQLSGFCTPAVSAHSQMLGKSNAMGAAMAQANCVAATQYLDRPMSVTSSPLGYCPVRRSSLATSVSTASPPESMISDTSRSSRTSRSSSISSASSLVSATLNSKLSVPSRFRAAKLCSERLSLKPSIPSVPEDDVECYFSSSPESYTGPVGKLGDLSLETPLARREQELEDMVRDPASDAARALQELHSHGSAEATPIAKTGSKRGRSTSIDDSLQENVREMLSGCYPPGPAWPNTLVRSRGIVSESYLQVPVRPELPGTGKRLCCSTEAASVHRELDYRGPGMWDGILN